jgi:hypothetical protein
MIWSYLISAARDSKALDKGLSVNRNDGLATGLMLIELGIRFAMLGMPILSFGVVKPYLRFVLRF